LAFHMLSAAILPTLGSYDYCMPANTLRRKQCQAKVLKQLALMYNSASWRGLCGFDLTACIQFLSRLCPRTARLGAQQPTHLWGLYK